MAYVPPHLRNRQSASAQTNSTPRSLESLQRSFKDTRISSEPSFTLDDISAILSIPKGSLNTLSVFRRRPSDTSESSGADPDNDVLRGILLFADQHPEWKADHKLLCKSNLHVLHRLIANPDAHIEGTESNIYTVSDADTEYPLFQEIPFLRRKFDFAGWWRIQSVDFLAPRSPELVAVFEKKFNSQNEQPHGKRSLMQRGKPLKTRSVEAWEDSLSREWAVVTLVRNQERKDRPEIPVEQHPVRDSSHVENSPDVEELVPGPAAPSPDQP